MTGYSRVQHEEADFALSVSVKSINHRFLDVQLRLSPGLDPLEPMLRNLIKDHIQRGHVEVQVNLDTAGQTALRLDRQLLASYVGAIQELRKEVNISAGIDPVALLRIPGMVASANGEIPSEQFQRVQAVLAWTAAQALDQLNEMKAREGAALAQDVCARLERLTTLAASVDQLAQDVPGLYRRRLERRLQEMLAGAGRPDVDDARMAQEVAFLASRSDIAEELTRFRSHLDQIRRLLQESAEVGKKLDFLLQEMNREANTMLSKTTDVPEAGLEITRQAIEMKAEIERLREQAQNIE